MQTSNKSVSFNSERGNDIYREREVIRLHISADSAPLINTSNSYLQFSLKMGDNGAYTIPDPALGGIPIETMQIYTGDGQTLLEQLDSVGIWNCMRNYYGNTDNDTQLQGLYEGRGLKDNPEFVPQDNAAKRSYPTSTNGNWLSRGGGFGSQYYQVGENLLGDNARKCQILYRFKMSGLLSSLRSEILANVVLDGLVLHITLMEGARFCRLQGVAVKLDGRVGGPAATNSDQILGYGILADDGAQSFTPTDPASLTYGADQRSYSMEGYFNAAGVAQAAGPWPVNTAASGIYLSATGDNYRLTDLRNCAFKVGSKIALGVNVAGAGGAGGNIRDAGEVTDIDRVITSVSLGTAGASAGLIELRFAAYTSPLQPGDPARAGDFMDQHNPCCVLAAGIRTDYEVSDVEYVANVVETPAGYVEDMVSQAQSGQLRIQFNTYQDQRVNITTGALANEIFIPTELQRAYCILGVNQILEAQSVYKANFSPSVSNLSNYQWILNGTNTPNIPVDLQRLAAGRVSPLQIIELEKAIDESSINMSNIQDPANFGVIARRLGAYGDSVSLLDKVIKARINYAGAQPLSLLWHFFIYHTSTILFEGGQRVVVM